VDEAIEKKSCVVEHVGLAVSGRARSNGRWPVIETNAGDIFYIAP